MPVNDTFCFLGIDFSTTGRNPITTDVLEGKLKTLAAAPLKPQQRMFLLTHHLLPGFYHHFTFSTLYSGTLKKMNISIRTFVRQILHLPKDLPRAAFHASTADGGLGIPSLRWIIPYLATKRGNSVPQFMTTIEGTKITNTNKIKCVWKRLLYKTADGKGLKEMSLYPQAHTWISDDSALLSG